MLKAKYIPLSFINTKEEFRRQVRNTAILKEYFNFGQTSLSEYLSKTQYGFTSSAKETGNCKLLRITDIKNGTVNWDDVPYCTCKDINKYGLSKNDILITRTGGTVGKSFLVNDIPFSSVFASYLIRISPKTDVNPKFIYFFLNSYYFWSQIAELKWGAAQPNVNANKIKTVQLPKIPKKYQDEIVRKIENEKEVKLEKSLKVYYDAKTELTHQQTLLTQLKQSILQDAISGKLTEQWRKENPDVEPAGELLRRIKAEKEKLVKRKKNKKEKVLLPIKPEEIHFEIPENWTWCKIGEVFNSTSGGTPERGNMTYWNGKISWLKSGELNDSFITNESSEKITEDGFNNSSTKLFPEGTLLIALYGATAGKLGILTFESTTNQAVCGFFENDFVLTKYLFYYLWSFRNKIIEDSWGQAQPNISQAYLKNFHFSLPPIKEQEFIVKKTEDSLNICNQIETQITQSQKDAGLLMQAVLKEAFEGEE